MGSGSLKFNINNEVISFDVTPRLSGCLPNLIFLFTLPLSMLWYFYKIKSIIKIDIINRNPIIVESSNTGGDDIATKLEKLLSLKEKGGLTDDEFNDQKHKLLNM